jgi:redox-sensing transcriptional repressor
MNAEGRPPLRHGHLERLMHYYHFITEHIASSDNDTVSSAQLAELLNMDDTQVRKDFAAIGVRGRARVGYRASEVVKAIREVLGFHERREAVLIGAGRLGGALAAYRGFRQYGLAISALVDADPGRAGEVIGELEVQPLDRLEALIAAKGLRIGVLTVPAEAAQDLADRLVMAGVRAIWNFAPTALAVPEYVIVRHEHISVGFAELAYYLKQSGR